MPDKMKLLGTYTARGKTTQGVIERVRLYQGTNKIGYRVTDFKVWASDYSSDSNGDVIGKLSKNDIGVTGSADFMRADDDNQIAWAGNQGNTNEFVSVPSIIDPENLIIEDLYVYARSGGSSSQAINYLITMEKYEIDGWRGTLEMARDEFDGE